jgi:CDP-glycerol glycerophosphotransferase (TagB/SpsB family)
VKVDKSNLLHWCYLAAFGANVLIARCLRRFLGRRNDSTVVLYGHRFAGNLRALTTVEPPPGSRLHFVFLTMDPAYFRELKRQGVPACLATSPKCVALLTRASAVISDHGLHAMQWLIGSRGLKFIDVWHGIPFKGFDAADFKVQHRYNEIWVASELHRRLYVERYGFDPSIVHVTGYARTDRLVRRDDDLLSLRRQFGVPESGKVVLFAPTWAQDATGRNIFPFGCDETGFLRGLGELAACRNATVLLRTHHNSSIDHVEGSPNTIRVPAEAFPDSEGVLMISDVLICDWSSIAFDFLLLERPTLFLDVPAPFRKGFSLGPEYRFGPILSDFPSLILAVGQALDDPSEQMLAFRDRRRQIRGRVYGPFADGKASQRCGSRLLRQLASG